MITSLDPYCDAFLYTHIETEGMMQGIPMEAVRPLRAATSKQLIVAGGISTNEEVEQAAWHGRGRGRGNGSLYGPIRLEDSISSAPEV